MLEAKVGFISLMAVIVVLVTCTPLPSSSCNTQLPGIGPRLMRAKAVFGNVMRACGKDIAAMAKQIPSNMLRKTLFVTCAHYNTCKPFYNEERLEDLRACLFGAVNNKSSAYYTTLKFGENFETSAQKLADCMWESTINMKVRDLQAIDDVIAFAKAAILNYGWT